MEVTPLRQSRKLHSEKEAKKRWMKIWDEIGSRILRLPPSIQDIVLDDINTAIKNRIAIMEMIENTQRRNRA